MADVVRSLVAALSFDADISGAKKFKKAFEGLSAKDFKDKLKFDEFEKGYNKALKSMTKKTFNFKKSLAVLGTALAGFSVKGFLTTKEVAKQEFGLETLVGPDQFKKIQSSIPQIQEQTGALRSQILTAFEESIKRFGKDEFTLTEITKNLPQIVNFTKLFPKKEFGDALSTTIAAAFGDKQALLDIGEVDAKLKDVLERANIQLARTPDQAFSQILDITGTNYVESRIKAFDEGLLGALQRKAQLLEKGELAIGQTGSKVIVAATKGFTKEGLQESSKNIKKSIEKAKKEGKGNFFQRYIFGGGEDDVKEAKKASKNLRTIPSVSKESARMKEDSTQRKSKSLSEERSKDSKEQVEIKMKVEAAPGVVVTKEEVKRVTESNQKQKTKISFNDTVVN